MGDLILIISILMQEFNFNKNMYKILEKKAIIYGAGSLGKTLVNTLKKGKIKTEAFIDARATVLKEEIIPVYELSKIEQIQDKDNYVVIISIRNVFEHSSLAKKIYKNGFKNIIFKPQSVLRSKENECFSNISKAYDILFSEFEIPKEQIYEYELERLFDFCDTGIIEESNEYVKSYLPSLFLFSNCVDSKFSVANFMTAYRAVELYKAFFNSDTSNYKEIIKKYIEDFAKPGAKNLRINTDGNWEELLIESRKAVFNNMLDKASLAPDFFVKNCTTVSARTKGGFYLIASGKNRVSFLIAMGHRYIPVRINKQEYSNYIDSSSVKELISYIEDNDKEIYAPIMHPRFYEYSVKCPDYYEKWVVKVYSLLNEYVYQENEHYDFQNKYIYDYSADEGAISRIGYMLGYNMYRKTSGILEELLDKIYNVDFHNNINQDERVYAIFVSCLKGVTNGLDDSILNKIEKYGFIFVKETDNEIEQLFDNHFKYKSIVCHTIMNGLYMKGIMYIK